MHRNPPWLELLQIAPVVVLAAPIVVRGAVDLASLPLPFTLGALLAVAVNGAVWRLGGTFNPIAVGTDLWLALGAVAFGVGVPALADVLASSQGFALFVVVTATSVAFLATPTGAIGARGEPHEVRTRSLTLLAVLLAATAWAWWFRHDVRLGGGLPFILCNVTRRVMIARTMGTTG